uniref:Uncharacterized protein n=1 Tax=Clastoptera arizonana TaxID=38151 RepID=A0A1B6DLG9_9HEMI
MLLARFRPLNSDSEDDGKCEDDIPTNTKEALEEKARSQYMKALNMVRDGKLNDAETELIQLIQSEVLTKTTGKVTFIAGRIKPSLEHLKYCCYLNLGHVYFQKEDLERAFHTYREALNLDDTDLNLLYKIGLVAIKMGHIDVAIEALEAALERSPNHWPSLDNLIVALYAGGGHVNCLYYISTALERDPGYGRGLAFRERIFKNHPTLKEHYNMFYPENKLDPEAKCNLPEELKDKYYSDVENLIKKRREQAEKTKKIPKPTPEYRIPFQPKSWQQLGVIILNAKKQFSAELLEQDFFRPINLLFEEDSSSCPLEMEVEVEEGEGDEDDDVDKINNEGSGNENEDVTENLGVRVKRRRSSPTYLDQWMSGKRRSARVRSTIRREEPSLARTLTDLTPLSLLQPKNDSKKEETFRFDDSMDTMDLYRLFENKEDDSSDSCNNKQIYYNISIEERENIIKQEEYFGSNQESRDVSDFLHKHNKKHIKDLFEAYSIALASKWNLHWSSNLISHYMSIFRLYMSHNLRRCAGHDYEISFELAKAVVLFSELALSQWVESGRSKGKPNPIGEGLFGGEIPLLYLGDLRLLSSKIEDKEFISRCWWVESLLYLYRGDIIGALHSFGTYLADERIESTEVKLYNMSIHYLINKNMVEGMVSSLTRKEMLLEVLNLYKEDNYEQMAELLCQVLKPDEHKVKLDIFQAPIDRHTQFNMLLEAYWNLKNYEECLKWGEIYLTEALNHYRGVLNLEECVTERSKWCDIISNTLHLMLCSIDEFGLSLMKVLEQSKKIRLVQSLMQTICHQVEALDTDVCIETTATWILLYLVIKYEEKNINSGEEVLPRSLQILFTAHEYLGRRAWCCMDDAAILYQTLKELKSLMDVYPSGSDMMLVLVQQLEQIFYCLYGHPIKRNKPRYIQEHNVRAKPSTLCS